MLKQDSGAKGLQASLGRALSAIPLTPNQWTLFSVALAALAGYAIAGLGDLPWGLALFALAAACDIIDGAVARARNQVSKLGGFIDGVADRFVEAAFLFSFMLYPLPTVAIDPKIWLSLAIFLGTCMPSFIRSYADHKGVISREKANALGGICERTERILIILVGLGAGLALSMDYFIWALAIASALSLVTSLQRLHAVFHEAGESGNADEGMKAQPKVKE